MDTEIKENVNLTFKDKLERLFVAFLDHGYILNALMCFAVIACTATHNVGRLFAICGWTCAAIAWISVGQERVWTKRWHSLADKAMKCLGAVFGGKVVGMGVCEVNGDKPQEDKPDSNDVSEDQKRAIMDLSKCIDEAIGYVKQENYEFTVSYGSVEIVMKGFPVKQAKPEPVSD